MTLKGKSAIVTGGAGALGMAIVQRFLSEGAKVAISCRDTKELARFPEPIRGNIEAIQADVTDEADVNHLFERAAKTIGSVDVLVNSVGGFLPRIPIAEVTLEQWDRMMNMNLKSSFLCTREALRQMKGKDYGRIVNISAMVGLNPSPGRAAYAISKYGVILLTDLAGQETKGTGITVNAIAPSIIDTEANRKSMPSEDFSKWVRPERIADLICYLCSDAAKDISGTVVKTYGGL